MEKPDSATVEKLIIELVKKETGIKEEIGPNESLQNLGLSSVEAMTMIAEIEDKLNIRLPDTLLWECNTIAELVENIILNFDIYKKID